MRTLKTILSVLAVGLMLTAPNAHGASAERTEEHPAFLKSYLASLPRFQETKADAEVRHVAGSMAQFLLQFRRGRAPLAEGMMKAFQEKIISLIAEDKPIT